MDRMVKLYDENNVNTIQVILSEEGYSKYLAGDDWDNSWIEVVIDVEAIKKADFS